MVDNSRCGHKGYLCVTPNDAEYCRQHCEDATDQDLTEIRCHCGRPGGA